MIANHDVKGLLFLLSEVSHWIYKRDRQTETTCKWVEEELYMIKGDEVEQQQQQQRQQQEHQQESTEQQVGASDPTGSLYCQSLHLPILIAASIAETL